MTIEQSALADGHRVAGDEPLFDVREVTVTYGGVRAVDGASLDVAPGEIHGLIGPNGAGKTSLIDAVTGFVQPRHGTVHLAGTDITEWPAHRRVRAGVVRTFQNLELFEDMTVGENLRSAARRHGRGDTDNQVATVTAEVNLDGRENVLVADLPHGTRRLVSVARALMTNPRVLVLDEPAAGLDSTETRRLGSVLRRLAGGDLAILLVDHDMELVMPTCDRVTVLNFGRVLTSATASVVRADPRVHEAYLGAP